MMMLSLIFSAATVINASDITTKSLYPNLIIFTESDSDLGILAPGTIKNLRFSFFRFYIHGIPNRQVNVAGSINSTFRKDGYSVRLNNCKWYSISSSGLRKDITGSVNGDLVSINNTENINLDLNNVSDGVMQIEVQPESIKVDRNATPGENIQFEINISVDYVSSNF